MKNTCPTPEVTKHSICCFIILAGMAVLSFASAVYGSEIILRKIQPPAAEAAPGLRPDLLPQSRIASGSRNITAAWFARATGRYRHGVLGDSLEATRLTVEISNGQHLHYDLPANRVFEDLEPRLADLDGDSRDEIIVVETDISSGASLAVYTVNNGQLVKTAATPFLGRSNRWLNPLGTGDFDGDGKTDIALVATPHIGGKLRLYHFKHTSLPRFAEYSGVSTHRIGSTELGLGRVISSSPRDLILVPDQSHEVLLLLEWSPDGWNVHERIRLAERLNSSLVPTGKNRFRFRLKDNTHYEIELSLQ